MTDLPFPVHITFRGVDRHAAIEDDIRSRIEHLTRFHHRIHGVEVVGHHHRGRSQHEDALLTVSDAFRAVKRQLEDRARVQRGEVKSHEQRAP